MSGPSIRTRGRVLPHAQRVIPNVEKPSSNVCVFPTEDQLSEIVTYLESKCHAAVSIGCGEGFLEGESFKVYPTCLRIPPLLYDVLANRVEMILPYMLSCNSQDSKECHTGDTCVEVSHGAGCHIRVVLL